MRWTNRLAAGAVGVSALGVGVIAQPCVPHWDAGLGLPGFTLSVLCLAIHDDGTGPALYAGGTFSQSGAMATQGVAKWSGVAWVPLADGLVGGDVRSLAVFDDDGAGPHPPALYAGGTFTHAGGTPVNKLARWNGQAWSAVGSGVTGTAVEALEVFDDGAGPALYVGGNLTAVGMVAAAGIARWDGADWSTLGNGLPGPGAYPMRLIVFDDGGGAALFATGTFSQAGLVAVNSIAKWNGSAWSALGAGLTDGFGQRGFGAAMGVFDDGDGLALYVGGDFSVAGGVPAKNIGKWDGVKWSGLGDGLDDGVIALAGFDDGRGPALYAGGYFQSSGPTQGLNRIAALRAGMWQPVGDPAGVGGPVTAFLRWQPSAFDAPELVAAGHFTTAGGMTSFRIAAWTACPAPETFALVAPSTGAACLPIPPTFSWSAAPFALSYDLTVSLNPSLAPLAYAALGLTSLSHTPPFGAVDRGHTYYWGVTAHNGTGQAIATPTPSEFATVLAGDVDQNGVVNFADLNAILGTFGARVGDLLYNPIIDLNHNGVIDFADLNNVLGNFGTAC